jgi:hypothetical protein
VITSFCNQAFFVNFNKRDSHSWTCSWQEIFVTMRLSQTFSKLCEMFLHVELNYIYRTFKRMFCFYAFNWFLYFKQHFSTSEVIIQQTRKRIHYFLE